jgi:hypothetical protein
MATRPKTFKYGTGPVPDLLSIKVKGSTTVEKGKIAVINAGYLDEGATATGLIAVGRIRETVVNSGADGAVRAEVEQGLFNWDNATAGDACAQTEVGTDVYILDDQTVTKTSTGRSKAGKLIDILDNGQCVVQMGLGVV